MLSLAQEGMYRLRALPIFWMTNNSGATPFLGKKIDMLNGQCDEKTADLVIAWLCGVTSGAAEAELRDAKSGRLRLVHAGMQSRQVLLRS